MKSVDLMSLCTFVCLFFCVTLWEKENTWESWIGFSLTERTEFTEPFCALFRTHRTPPAYRIRRTFQLKVAVRFCEIGWLNVSVECCVFCSSVLSVRKRILENCRGEFLLSRRIFLSLTELTDLTEPFCALFRTHRTPPAYRYHRGLTPSPSPNGEGSSMWGYPYWSADDRRWAA